MAIEKTDTIILKSFKYGETSKIARCYTREYGKISVIAKGVRKSKTLQSGYLEPLNYIALMFYHNPRRQIQIFSKAEYKCLWRSLKGDMKKTIYGFAVVELIDRSVTGEEPHQALFELLIRVLKSINKSEGNVNVIYWYFVIHLLSLLGFRPHLSNCPRCHKRLELGIFSREYGELLCKPCYGESMKGDRFPISPNFSDWEGSGQGFVVSSRCIKILKKLKQTSLDQISSLSLKPGDRKELGGFLNHHLRYHIEGLTHVKSLEVMEDLLT